MKKVFIDTNVILDFILHREHWAEAKDVVAHFVENRTVMVMSVGGFYTMHYLIDKYLRKELHLDTATRIVPLRTLLTRILQTFNVAEHDNASLLRGVVAPQYTDLEDSCQYQLAIKSGCELLITFDIGHFPQTGDEVLRVVTPQAFLESVNGAE